MTEEWSPHVRPMTEEEYQELDSADILEALESAHAIGIPVEPTTALGAAETVASCNSSRALELGLNHGPALRTTSCASPRVFLGVHPAGD